MVILGKRRDRAGMCRRLHERLPAALTVGLTGEIPQPGPQVLVADSAAIELLSGRFLQGLGTIVAAPSRQRLERGLCARIVPRTAENGPEPRQQTVRGDIPGLHPAREVGGHSLKLDLGCSENDALL